MSPRGFARTLCAVLALSGRGRRETDGGGAGRGGAWA